MIIAIEGPEKAGKSTFVSALADAIGARVRHWGPVNPDDRAYMNTLIEDTESKKWVIWDRCWPSEHIYGSLLGRKRRLSNDPWLGEWLHGRALQVDGLKAIILPSNMEDLMGKRDASDLPVPPILEAKSYAMYAKMYGWDEYINNYDNESIQIFVSSMLDKIKYIESAREYRFGMNLRPPLFAGSLMSDVIFMENANGVENMPGGWLPFSGIHTTAFARKLGNSAFEYGWTNTNNTDAWYLASKKVVACGDEALIKCSAIGVSKILALPDVTRLLKLNDTHSPEVEYVVNVTKLFCKGEQK